MFDFSRCTIRDADRSFAAVCCQLFQKSSACVQVIFIENEKDTVSGWN